MIPGHIENATHVFGAPVNWDPDQYGPCSSLAIRKDGPAATSAWHLTPDEIERVNSGAPVYLTILGNGGHPVVALEVGDPPEDEPPFGIPELAE